jgi:Flp pilus assembly CpaF family ATPase
MTVQAGNHAPETGFMTVAYFMHNGKVDTSLVKWTSDTEVSKYYDELKAKVSNGVDMNNPTLKACMTHYPALRVNSTDPAMQQAAVSLRALLVRHCLADHAALKNLYADMYFIHR